MSEDLKRQLWENLDRSRGITPFSDQLLGWLKTGSNFRECRERLQVWLATVGAGHSRAGGGSEFLSTAEVAAFMAKLGAVGGGSSVLDPACGVGLLLSFAAEELGAFVVHGIELNTSVAEMARLLLPESTEVFNGNTLNAGFLLEAQYDLIISEPPFCVRLREPYLAPAGGGRLADVGDALFCWSASKLSAKGRAVFLLPASCLFAREKVWDCLAAEGAHIRALIHVPSGQLKATAVESYIAVVDRTPREQIFIAQFGTDAALQKQIITNFDAHLPGERPAQGRLVERAGFRGFRALDATERLKEMAKRKGLKPVSMKELVIEHAVLKGPGMTVDDSANDLYMPLTGRCEAVLQPEELSAKSGRIVRLIINGDLADARFVAASLNEEIGRLFLETVTAPTNILRQVSIDLLLEGTFYLPSAQAQKQALDLMSRVRALRAEIDEIESGVWAHPAQVEKQIQHLRRVNHEDSLEGWMEGLPFPLASILWRFHAFNGSTKDKNEILLQFFEALAEFWATIYLSAAKSDREFWADHVNALAKTLEGGKLSFDQATFGLWKCVIEFLSKKFRKLLNDDSDRCTAMFRTGSHQVLEMLFDRRLIGVLQTANSLRNDHAHRVGAGTRAIEIAHDQLNDLVQTCRSVMGTTWERYELVQPTSECRFVGGVFDYKVRRVMGTRTPFVTVLRKTIEGMEAGALHFLDPDGNRTLKLLAFIRVMPSPRTEANACYFYNRRQANNQTFVSYHFEADSEVEKFFTDTQAALEGMRPFANTTQVDGSYAETK